MGNISLENLGALLKTSSRMHTIELSRPSPTESAIKPEKEQVWNQLKTFITSLQQGMFDERIPPQERTRLLKVAHETGIPLFRDNPELFPDHVGRLVIEDRFPGREPSTLTLTKQGKSAEELARMAQWTGVDFYKHLTENVFPTWKK